MDKGTKKEIKRMRQILHQIVSMAEEENMEGGLGNAVKRYNAIVRHLETASVLPPGLFQPLNEEPGAVTFDQAGVESRMLSGYLEEVIDEEEEDSSGKPDFGPVIALAPFLDQHDLKALVHSHLSGRGFVEPQPPPNSGGAQPTLEALVGLAPHMDEKDLAQMVETCLAREPLTDPRLMMALAPHLDQKDLGRIMRQHLPNWFASRGQEVPPAPPAPAAPQTTPAPAATSPEAAWQDAPRPPAFER